MLITAIQLTNRTYADCFRGDACWKSAISVRETRVGVVGVGGSPWVFDWFGMGVRQPLWVFRQWRSQDFLKGEANFHGALR